MHIKYHSKPASFLACFNARNSYVQPDAQCLVKVVLIVVFSSKIALLVYFISGDFFSSFAPAIWGHYTCVFFYISLLFTLFFIIFADPLYIFLGEQTNLTCTLYRFRTVYNTSGSENHVLISKWNKQNLNISSYVIDNDNSTVTAHAQDVVSVNSVPERVAILWYLCTSPLCEGKSAQRFLNIESKKMFFMCLVFIFNCMHVCVNLSFLPNYSRNNINLLESSYENTFPN